jgi:hypothetical protein
MQKLVLIGFKIDSSFGRILTGCPFNIFLDFLILVCRKGNMYAWYFYQFYATTMNILTGFHTP